VDLILLAARLLLTGVFLVAGIAKLADRAGSQKAVRDFGVPQSLAAPFGNLLPIAEIAVAIALIPVATAWWGALGALGLLSAFVAGIAYNMARGRAPECHCFGQLHSSPAGWRTLVRNLGLAAVAVLLLVAGRTDPGVDFLGAAGRVAQEQPAIALALAAVSILAVGYGWLLLRVLQQQGRLVRRVRLLEAQLLAGTGLELAEGLPVGTAAPAFTLADTHGSMVSLGDLLAGGRPVLLAFLDPDCGPCRALMPQLIAWHLKHADRFEVVALSRGSAADNALILDKGLTAVLLQQRREIDELYRVEGTPGAVLVRPDGTIGSPHAAGADQIESLVAGLAGELGDSPLTSPVSAHDHAHPANRGHANAEQAHGDLESASA